MFNPIFKAEVVRSARRGHPYTLRIVFGLVVLIYLASEYAAWDVETRLSVQALGRHARAAFARFAILQDVAIVALVPALMAGAVAEEDRRRTLPDLLASRLTAAEIVLGKLGSRLVHVVGFVLVGLPAVLLLGLVGGLDAPVVAAVYSNTAALILLAAGVSMLLSTLLRRPRDAIASAYGALAAWAIGPWLLDSILGVAGWASGRGLAPGSAFRAFPILGWLRLWLLSLEGTSVNFPPAFSRWLVGGLRADLPWSIGVPSCLGLVCLATAVACLRPLRGDPAGRRHRRPGRRAPTRPGCGDAPMLWKERHAAGSGSRLRWPFWVLGVLLLAPTARALVEHVLNVFRVRAELGFFPDWSLGEDLVAALRSAHLGLFVVWQLAVAGGAAMGVTGEREAGTWDALRLTALGGREVVPAKQYGAIRGSRGLAAALLVLWILGLALGLVHPLGVVAALAGAAAFAWSAAALGTAVSLVARDSTRALVATSAALFLADGGYLVPLLALRPTSAQSPLSLAGMAPYLEWAILFPPWVFEPWWNPLSFPAMLGPMIAYEGPAVLPAFALGLILHASAAAALTTLSIRLYDAPKPRRQTSKNP